MKLTRASLIGVLAAACLCVAGCTWFDAPKADLNGQRLTEEQIRASVKATLADAADKLQRESAAAAEEVRAAQAAQQALAEKTARDYALKLQKLSSNATVDAAAVNNEMADILASSNQTLSTDLSKIVGTHQASQTAISAAANKAKAMGDIALADIQSQIEQRSFLANSVNSLVSNPAVQGTVGALPGGGILLSLLGMAGTAVTGWAARSAGSAKRHEKSRKDGFEEGKNLEAEKTKAANDAWEESQKDASHKHLLAAVLGNGIVAVQAAPATVTASPIA